MAHKNTPLLIFSGNRPERFRRPQRNLRN